MKNLRITYRFSYSDNNTDEYENECKVEVTNEIADKLMGRKEDKYNINYHMCRNLVNDLVILYSGDTQCNFHIVDIQEIKS